MWCKPLCTWPRKKLLIKSTLSMLNCCINWNLHSLRVMIIKKQQSIKLAVQQAQSNFLVHRIPPSIMIQLQRVYLERWSLYSIDPGSKCALLASFEYSVNASPLRLSLILHHDALCDLVISAAIPSKRQDQWWFDMYRSPVAGFKFIEEVSSFSWITPAMPC